MSDTQFKFVGQSEAGTSTKVRWPILAQGLVIQANISGATGASAFQAGVARYNELADDGEVEGRMPEFSALPESYRNKNAGSVLYGMKKRFLARVNKHDAETVRVAEELGIIEPRS
jgi:hypothetical protein